MDKKTVYLVHETARKIAAHLAMNAPDGWRARFEPPKRTLEQNDKFHAICEDVAKSGAVWMGKRRSKEAWKVLFISGHAIDTGEGAEVIAGIEGELVNIRESSAQMTIARGSSLIEYTLGWCATNGIELREQAA